MDELIGKYVGFVRDAGDPDARGRLRLFVPEVMGPLDDTDHWTDWALPCFPWFATQGIGAALVPQVNSGWAVWVEFRQGDARFPIWIGVFPVAGTVPDPLKMKLEAGDAFTVTAADTAQIDSAQVLLGGSGIPVIAPGPANEGVVLGSGIDSFTGAPYSVLGSTSTKVFARKT